MNTEQLEDKMIAALEGELNSTEYNALMDLIEKDEELVELWKSYECMYGALNKVEMVEVSSNSKLRFTEFLKEEVASAETVVTADKSTTISLLDWRKFAAMAAVFIGVLFMWNINQNENETYEEELVGQSALVQAMTSSSSTDKIKAIRVHYDAEHKDIDDEMISLLFDVLEQDASSNVRLAAVESLSHHSERSDVRAALIKSLDSETDGFVKLAIIKSLSNRFNTEIENKFEGIINDRTNEKFIIDEVQKELFRHASVEI